MRNSLPELFVNQKLPRNRLLCLEANVSKNNVSNPNYINFLNQDFKLAFKNHKVLRGAQRSKPNATIAKFDVATNVRMFKSFKTFIQLNSNSFSTLTIPHHSFRSFYLGYSKGGLVVLNLAKLFNRWKDVYYLFFNLFFYKIDMLTFGSSFFKTELLALNWQVMSKFKFMWRYTRPVLTLKPNKITIYGDFIFTRLSLLGMRMGLVIDVLYHTKTIYYLRRTGFYTLGLVPVNYNLNTLDFAIPSSSDSLLTQIFVIRLLTVIKQNTSLTRYSNVKNL